MTLEELKLAILALCLEILATRTRNPVCSISWFPDEWPHDEVMRALHALQRDGLISATRNCPLLVDGFVLNRRG